MSRYNVHDPNAYFNFLKEKREDINKISPTFCLAKWLQSTILLYSGETHSCHHPSRHKIQDSDIKDNCKGIHNTAHKMKARRDMLNGIQTVECDYCWKIENLPHDYISDRIYKSVYTWALPYIDDVVKSEEGHDIDPSYLEVAFETTCNFKCIYCSPESSSLWESEISKHGPIKQTKYNLHDLTWLKKVGKLPIPADEHNPYIEAFWKWWPDLYPKLHIFRLTGGEPLLSKHTWKLLDYIKEHSNPNLVLAVNTNCNVPSKYIDKLIDYIKDVNSNIDYFDVYTSIESVGKQAEYARNGLDYEKFLFNCNKILSNTPNTTRLHFMTTINILSAPTLLDFFEVIKELRMKYNTGIHKFRVRTLLSYLRWPKTLQLTLLSEEDKKKYGDLWLSYIEENKLVNIPKEISEEEAKVLYSKSFYTEEVDQIKRLVEYMQSTKEEKHVYDDMRLYIKQCDERRNTNFLETFPELTYLMENNYYG